MSFFKIITISWLVFSGSMLCAKKTRIKDLANVQGVRSNRLIGYGLVVGLSGTGDSEQSIMTQKAALNMLRKLGVDKSVKAAPSGNLAAVIVTAELPLSRKMDRKLIFEFQRLETLRALRVVL